MKRTFSLAAATFAFLLIAPTMYGQTHHMSLRFHVPFSFNINDQTFTPGEYEFTQQSLFLVKVANLKSDDSAVESVQPAQSRKEGNGQVKLVFHRYNGQYFLAAVSDGSWESTYDFKISTEEKQLAQASPRKPMTTVSVDPAGTVLVAERGRN
jgi:hypothetical protein